MDLPRGQDMKAFRRIQNGPAADWTSNRKSTNREKPVNPLAIRGSALPARPTCCSTDPSDPSDLSDLSVLWVASGGVAVEFRAKSAEGPGYTDKTRHYRLEQSGMVDGGWWMVDGFADVIGAGQTETYRETGGAAPKYFRLAVWLE